jgi:hypothetical protein
MTQDQFNEFINETIPSALFHVEPTDRDDKTGVRLDELILLQCLNDNPRALRFKNLKWFVDRFIPDNVEKPTQLYIADCIEHDSWSGKKRDGYVAFLSKEAFDEYQRNEQLARVGNFPIPEYYENFENGRYADCITYIHDRLNESLLMGNSFCYFNKIK